MKQSPRLLLTMGDVAGIGPEVIARAWPALTSFCRPVVVGDPAWLRRAFRLVNSPAEIRPSPLASSPTIVAARSRWENTSVARTWLPLTA